MIGFRLTPTARLVWLGLALAALATVALRSDLGWAAPSEAAEIVEDLAGEDSAGSSGALLLLAALAAMIVLGSPLFVIIGVIAAMCFMLYGDGYELGVCATLDSDVTCGYDTFPAKMAGLTTKNVLLAIPFFVVSGSIMSAGDIANRLVAFAKAVVGWMPGGLAVATVGGCVFFAAISGSSPVTVIAIGATMYPALVKAGYSHRFSIGLVSTAGSLGILIPPSIPMLVFAIVAGGRTPLDIGELFMAGIVPGLFIAVLLSIYSVWIAKKSGRTDRTPFSLPQIAVAFRDGFWAVMLPVIILGGIYSGLFTATEAAAVSVVYALVVELGIHRTLTVRDLPKILSESAVMMGTLLIIMALAFGLNDFLVEEKVPDLAVEWIRSMNLTPVTFLLVVNLLLLVVGALMDSISAIMIIAPLLKPIADQVGIDPVHLGIIFIVNLEIGYLTPPIGINLFVASSVFGKPMGEVIKSVVPFIVLMLGGLVVVTYVPTLSLGPVNVFLRDKPFYQALPVMDESGKIVQPGAKEAGPQIRQAGEVSADGKRKVLSVEEMSEIGEQMYVACEAATTILGDDTIAPADRRAAFTKAIAAEGVANENVVPVFAPIADGTPDPWPVVAERAKDLMDMPWDCDDLKALLAPADAKGGAPDGGDAKADGGDAKAEKDAKADPGADAEADGDP